MFSILEGLCQHFHSFKLLRIIFCNSTHLQKWSSVVLKNVGLVILANRLFEYFLQYVQPLWWIKYMMLAVYSLFYFPLFLYCYIITIDTIGFIVDADQQKHDNEQQKCTKPSRGLLTTHKLYLGIFSGAVYVFPLLCQFIPYIGVIILPVITSLVNSFYYFYFAKIRTCSSATELFYTFEKHIGFFVGYGLPELLCQMYLHWEVFYVLNFLMLPLNILNISHNKTLVVSEDRVEKKKSKETIYVSKLFVIPLMVTNVILDMIIFGVSVLYNDTSILKGREGEEFSSSSERPGRCKGGGREG